MAIMDYETDPALLKVSTQENRVEIWIGEDHFRVSKSLKGFHQVIKHMEKTVLGNDKKQEIASALSTHLWDYWTSMANSQWSRGELTTYSKALRALKKHLNYTEPDNSIFQSQKRACKDVSQQSAQLPLHAKKPARSASNLQQSQSLDGISRKDCYAPQSLMSDSHNCLTEKCELLSPFLEGPNNMPCPLRADQETLPVVRENEWGMFTWDNHRSQYYRSRISSNGNLEYLWQDVTVLFTVLSVSSKFEDYRRWIPADNILREVIEVDIQRYLGLEAVVLPGRDDAGNDGYWISSYRTLTSSMIRNLKADSANFERSGSKGMLPENYVRDIEK
ncbi:hypothetical protein EJ08DRAFT_692052 [Tothia fuscella]|uniref:Uncharacterized protein n=1 Tax=Tothia fuscella TaxID=1048955 RepID=A0A9P4P3D4_9PEZI|nr:hypothetical protein EJ08DRAFT_692052 [Tothia fuscella]